MSDKNVLKLPDEVLMARVKEYLDAGKDVALLANGQSMLPFIIHGKDVLVLRRCPRTSVGDVVLARTAPGKYVIHRVIDISDGEVTLKGDGNLYMVEKCMEQDVMGTLVEIRKPGGRIRKPGFGRRWHKMPLLVRRVVIAICKRLKK